VFAEGLAPAFAFVATLVFAGELVLTAEFVFVFVTGVSALAGRAPLSSFGFSTTFFEWVQSAR
jgi:hypothetical protein